MQFASDRYIIECRTDGRLDFTAPQPQDYFGPGAYEGMHTSEMAEAIYIRFPDCDSLRGTNIPDWPKVVDPRWVARLKTW